MSIQSKGSLISFLFLGFTLLGSLSVLAQEMSFGDTESYILGDLKVTGLKSYNEQTVKTYTGLRVGQLIEIPGEEISGIIKNYGTLNSLVMSLFTITTSKGIVYFWSSTSKNAQHLIRSHFTGLKNPKQTSYSKTQT